ncbi:acyltransferase family protein [Methylobacterium sp. A54F]
MSALRASVISSVVFASNIYFYTQAGYFSSHLDWNPLLHTWSLSVEEQFYIFLPLVMLLLRRVSRRTSIAVIGLLALASFVVSWQQLTVDRSAAFYLLPSRGWELLLGSLLAIGAVPRIGSRFLCECLAVIGLGLILASVVLLSPLSLFPGPGAAAACLGAAAIIHAGEEHRTATARLLSVRPIVYVGLISYSLYIWHWPITVFIQSVHPGNGHQRLAVIAVCFVVAALSERFIERPFRRPQAFAARPTVACGLAAMTAVAALALVIGPLGRLVNRVPAEAGAMQAYENYDHDGLMRSGSCFLTPKLLTTQFDREGCLKLSATRRNYLLIGDSHAAHLFAGLTDAHPEINFLQATAAGCHPTLPRKPWDIQRCKDLIEDVLFRFVPEAHLDGVVLSAEWKRDEIGELRDTVRYLSRHVGDVVIAGPSVEYDMTLPRVLAIGIRDNRDLASFARQHRIPEAATTDAALAGATFPQGSRYVSVYAMLCPDDCILRTEDGAPIQFDRDHLTRAGSVFIGRQFRFDVGRAAAAEP